MFFNTAEQDLIESFMLGKLPHGSGIDCKWEFKWQKNECLIASNSFHCMDEHGFYCGYADFSVKFNPTKSLRSFDLTFHGPTAHKLNERYMLRDYLESTIYESVPDDLSPHMLSITLGNMNPAIV